MGRAHVARMEVVTMRTKLAACLLTVGCAQQATEPVDLATAQSPTSITVDGTNVYWTNRTGEVMKCAVDGCDHPAELAVATGVPASITASATDVYWTDGAVSRVPMAGGAVTRIGASDAWGIAVGAQSVYWTTNATAGPVFTCAVEGCAPAPTRVAGGDASFAIAADAANVYWSDWNAIWTCPLAGCAGTPTALAAVAGHVAIAIDAHNVYWAYPDEGVVLACAKAGCQGSPTLLASHAFGVTALASDGANVYWVSTAGVTRCSTSGCPTPTLLTPNATGGIAIDETSIYFWHGGSITKLPK
jgi:hypothetical protein